MQQQGVSMEKQATKWWDKLGKPEYGGELVIRANNDIVNFDPIHSPDGNIHTAWLERLVSPDWTVAPEVFDFKPHWHPSEYMKGQLAESWEFTDNSTYVAHLRHGIHWQHLPPTHGREFTADDVVFHYHRLCGLGEFAKPGAVRAGPFQDMLSVTAADRYTVVFKWKIASPRLIMEAMHMVSPSLGIVNPDVVKKYGDLNDWHHAIGTGPFILKSFKPGVEAVLGRNKNYWGHDERYPENKLPYLDKVKFVILPDEAEAIELMRRGKIDIIDHISPTQAYALRQTNPEVSIFTHPDSNAESLEPRNDLRPFNDIRVRKAMQMAIDLQGIADSHYNGIVDPYPAMLTSRYMTGWGYPYEEWPQDLKNEYAYNPAAAKKLLAEAGYPDGFKTNVAADASQDIELMRIVKQYFATVGIEMEIRIMPAPEWSELVLKNRQHDQLAYRAGGPLGHTSAPNYDITAYQKGGRNNWAMVDDKDFDTFLPRVLAADNIDELKEVMREANEYVARQHFSIALLQPMAYSLCQPWVKGFTGQFGAAWAHAGGPAMSSFYLGRFWIDTKMKKSR
jgi:peptide/nickel transport system substrate-binding protein